MMLEADIVMGAVRGAGGAIIPIMAHPPDNTSDISLEQWLTETYKYPNVGLKLDFKQAEAFLEGLKILKMVHDQKPLKVPVWLNADIAQANGGTPKFSPDEVNSILAEVNRLMPFVTLSLGWTTATNKGSNDTANYKYTQNHVDAILRIIKEQKVNQPITFPVRAAMLPSSIDVMRNLLDLSDTYSLTVWTSSADSVDIKGLRKVRKVLPKDVVYWDLPYDDIRVLRLRGEPGT